MFDLNLYLGEFMEREDSYKDYCERFGMELVSECPICGFGISPDAILAARDAKNMYMINSCPKCNDIFLIKYNITYEGISSRGTVIDKWPKNSSEKKFGTEIQDISPSFVKIYNQAKKAEDFDLDEISGIGYRKSLEFLIKDYLKQKLPGRSSEIEEKRLGKCIDELIANPNIKAMAKMATWLGNDETHYIKKWENKDITDLKKMIDLTVQWIILEKMTQQYQEEMNL